MTNIMLCQTDVEILSCYPVMSQLRPQIDENEFVGCVRDQMQAGYQLVCIQTNDVVSAVAGYRIAKNLAWGKYLYVDDLVTDSATRSTGMGKQLLHWLIEEARNNSCSQCHLDSGVQRLDAHRFYEREGMHFASQHFVVDL
ncbi:MAG: GNAT family N-acetyltransferase [Proteobacteria bacterium]|nr:GNAT family N-acetyltransferase [Pseudomonadota bacterium]